MSDCMSVEEALRSQLEQAQAALEGSQTIRQDAAMLGVTPDHLFAEVKRQVAIQWDEMKRLEQSNARLEERVRELESLLRTPPAPEGKGDED